MNRHRTYWSAMGPGESDHREKMRSQLKSELIKLVNLHGFWNVVTTLRKLKENEEVDTNTVRDYFG